MTGSQSPSVEPDHYDEEQEGDELQQDGETTGTTSKGRKKTTTNQAARRDQNRIAQREFRLRKQQRIRDLEARVELLSGSKEETHAHSRAIIHGLMEENSRLRALVRDLGGFIGEALGGPLLAKTGWTMNQFQDFVSRSDSDTAFEAYTLAKQSGQSTSTTTEASTLDLSGPATKKRKKNSSALSSPLVAGPSAFAAPSTDRARSVSSPSTGNTQNPLTRSPNELPAFLPQPHRTPSGPLTSGAGSSSSNHPTPTDPSGPTSFSSLMDTITSSAAAPYIDLGNPSVGGGRQLPPPPMTKSISNGGSSRDLFGAFGVGGSASGSASSPASVQSPVSGSSNSMAGLNVDSFAMGPGITALPRLSPQERRERSMVENESKKHEAGKLIKYHLDNYKRSQQYFLPTSLRPTLVQRTMAHDNLIDGIIYPEIRDRMILLKDRFDLAECITMLLWSTIVHGDDVLASTNWELGEDWLKRYGFLVEEHVLDSVNKWRRARGDVELTMADISGDTAASPANS